MVSVERVLEYSQLPSEAQLETEEEQKPPRDWPQQGEIISRNVYLKYTEESPYILKDLSFTIHPRQKVILREHLQKRLNSCRRNTTVV